MTRQAGPFTQSHADETILNLALGQPTPALLPLEGIREAASERLTGDPLVLQYGTPAGYPAFREALAAFLSDGYGQPVVATELALTSGTSAALALVSQVLSRSGDRIACGDPTYFLAKGIFETHGLEVVGIDVDVRGLDVAALARQLEGGLRIAFAYVIPAFHNPTGVTLSAERAEQLIALAEQYDFVVVADEPYPLLHFEDASVGGPGTLAARDGGRGRVLSLGSFSKILAPGLRLGWAQAAPALLGRVLQHGAIRSGGALNPVMAAIVHGCIESGFLARHVTVLRETFGERVARLTAALARHAPSLSFAAPRGGYFVWARAPAGVDTSTLDEAALAAGVRFCPGTRCAVARDLRRELRLSFAFYTADELEEAARRLGRLFG